MHIRMAPRTLRIPHTLSSWPWPRHINPHYKECKQKSAMWAESFRAFGPKAQIAFNKCDFSLLASMAYAGLDKDGCQVGCDLMSLFFIFDEWSDISDEKETRHQADAIMDALRNPSKPRPAIEWVGGEATSQFWLNAIKTATPSAQKRFIAAFQHYTDAVVQQSADRTHSHIRDIKSYLEIRRETIGAKPSFVINRIHDDIDDDTTEHPAIKSLEEYCIDMLIIGNDLCSYNVEQSRGDDEHNLVTVVMNELGLGIQAAFDWIELLYDEMGHRFMTKYMELCRGQNNEPGLDKQIRYADALGNWVRANDQWSFESKRYFGDEGLEVLKTRTVALLPKKEALKPVE